MLKEWLLKLQTRYTVLFKVGTFLISSGTGFVVAEIILTIGVLVIFGSISVRTDIYASPILITLDIVSLIIGVTVSFFINQTSFKWAELIGSASALFTRLLKFQLVSLGGNVLIIVIQLLLLREYSVSPSIGSVIGAVATFPLTYLFSMRYVWEISRGRFRVSKDGGDKRGKVAKS